MNTSFPLNSMPAAPVTGNAGFHSASAAANKVAAIVTNAIKRYLLAMRAVSPAFVILSMCVIAARAAGADNFELAMVIKETTNPYYNATLSGARIAAGEIGGTANNYGPTQASGQAQVEIINNLADRHIPAIAVAGDEAGTETGLKGHYI
jgi:ABC-type sugar transport system substrate-binding protein